MSSEFTSIIASTGTSTLPPLLHSFPSSWTAPTSCFASTNYYRVFSIADGNRFSSNMYGTPTPVFDGNTPSGDCFPPSFTINVPYLTDGSACPTGYTRACATAASVKPGELAAISTITCCPSVTGDAFPFRCRDDEYGCHATAPGGGIAWTGVATNLGVTPATESSLTRTPRATESVAAWGIKLLSVAPGSAAASTPTPSQNTENQGAQAAAGSASSGSLSGGAIAGIVIGSIAGVALLAIGAFLLYPRKKFKYGPAALAPSQYPNRPRNDSMHQLSTVGSPSPSPAPGQVVSSHQPSEMGTTSPYSAHSQPGAYQEPVELA